jgi:hypothetical protein
MAKYIIELESNSKNAATLVRVICKELSTSLAVMSEIDSICAFKDDESVLISDGDLIYG